MKTKKIGFIIIVVFILGFAASAQAKWHFGLGTGLMALNAQGDLGIDVAFAGVGPVVSKMDLSPSDFNDLTDRLISLEGFATDGKWMIRGKFEQLDLLDDARTTKGPFTISSEFSIDITVGELTVGYPLMSDVGAVLRGYTGFRYLKHELGAKILINSLTLVRRDTDEDWTDVLIGLSADVPLAEKWKFATKFDAGFGGSEGSCLLNSELTWMFAKHWSTVFFGQYYAIDFENGSKGDTDWYLYDVNEFGFGAKVFFNW